MSVRDVVTPEDLSESQRAEFNILAKALLNLENKWLGLRQEKNQDQMEYAAIFDREFDVGIRQCEVIEELDLESIEKEYKEQEERIRKEFADDQKNLFKRIIRGYQQSCQSILPRLKELMGPDFEAWHAEHEIEFPQCPLDKNQDRKGPQPEEPKIAFSPHETDKQVKEIKNDIQKWATSEDVSDHTE